MAIKKRVWIPLVLIVLAVVAWAVVRASGKASLSVAAVSGVNPEITAPDKPLVPTMNIAPVVGWKAGETPTPSAGLSVTAFASGLDHPRWMLPLPNGDVLVAETNAPPKPEDGKGLRGWVQKKVMARAGAGVASPNRIMLLRDANGDGVAEQRSVLISGLNSPFGMTLVGDQLYVADTDALLRFPFRIGQTRIDAATPG